MEIAKLTHAVNYMKHILSIEITHESMIWFNQSINEITQASFLSKRQDKCYSTTVAGIALSIIPSGAVDVFALCKAF